MFEDVDTPHSLEWSAVRTILAPTGIEFPSEIVVSSRDGLSVAVGQLRFPLVMKLSSQSLVHKSDSGGVIVGISSAKGAEEAWATLTAVAKRLRIAGGNWSVLVQEMVRSGPELFAGIKRDPAFGPVVVCGAGGLLVEWIRRFATRLCPIDDSQALQMFAEAGVLDLLGPFRGSLAADPIRWASTLAALSRLAVDRPDVAEIDLNPLVVGPAGQPIALDARVLQGPGTAIRGPRDVTRSVARARSILEANSVAILGASRDDRSKVGSRVLDYLDLHGFAGAIHVVHPTAWAIAGHTCVPSIEALPRGIDLACIVLESSSCTDAVMRCAARGIKAAIVISSGFSEIGDSHKEAMLVRAANDTNVALCGPNTIGVISVASHLHMCFSQAQDTREPIPGTLALLVQSGALGGSLLSVAWERGIGISRFICVGNQAQLDVSDYLQYLATDAETSSVALLLEGVSDGSAFLAGLRSLRDAGKPAVVLKMGVSDVGGFAVSAHTGSLAGESTVYDAVFRAAGAVPVRTLPELLDVAWYLGSQPLPAGRRVAIVSTSGGAGSLTADLCIAEGLEVPKLPESDRDRLAKVLPPYAALRNPVDVTGQVTADPSLYASALEILVASESIDSVLVVLTTLADPQAEVFAEDIIRIAAGSAKPVVISWTIARTLAARGMHRLEEAGLPVMGSPDRAVRVLRGMVARAEALAESPNG
jgi:acyl-CoA synthetase (NDP forming)